MNQLGTRALRSAGVWVLALLSLPAPLVWSQTLAQVCQEKTLAFEVVSIRGHKSGYWPSFERQDFTPDGLDWVNVLPQTLITFAYDIRDPKLQVGLIPGAPKWIRSEWYDVRAKMSDSDFGRLKNVNSEIREACIRQMVRSLLADRFNLKLHLVSTESVGYELVVAKSGLKNFKVAPPDEPAGITAVDSGDLQYHNTPLTALLLILPQMLGDAPVVDKTGLTENYDFELKWERESSPMPGSALLAPSPVDGSWPSIFKALEEQIGLKLVPTRMPIQRIVIDHIEHPSPN